MQRLLGGVLSQGHPSRGCCPPSVPPRDPRGSPSLPQGTTDPYPLLWQMAGRRSSQEPMESQGETSLLRRAVCAQPATDTHTHTHTHTLTLTLTQSEQASPPRPPGLVLPLVRALTPWLNCLSFLGHPPSPPAKDSFQIPGFFIRSDFLADITKRQNRMVVRAL